MAYEMDSFELVGADGKRHVYRGTLHPAGEGMRIVARLAELGAEPLAKLATQALATEGVIGALGSLAKGAENKDPEADAAAMTALRAAVPKLKIDDAVRELRPLLADAPDLTAKIISKMWRDGKPLSDGTNFDAAFAGNYVELGQAVWAVARANGFFPSLGTFSPSASK